MATRGLKPAVSRGVQELSLIDWHAPWLRDWAALGEPIAKDALKAGINLAMAHVATESPMEPSGNCVAEALNLASERLVPDLAVRFVSQAGLPPGWAYEAFIRANGSVPTRDNAHDFFNGLAWLHTPRIKTRLNEFQAAEIAAMGVGSTRGPVRDAITVLDENGAFLIAPSEIWQALRERQWSRLFVELRPLWSECRLWPFGHALQEKLIHPRKNIVAHVLEMELPMVSDWRTLDEMVARRLESAHLGTKPFVPLPVLGIPGWCAQNESEDFYADAGVFRPLNKV